MNYRIEDCFRRAFRRQFVLTYVVLFISMAGLLTVYVLSENEKIERRGINYLQSQQQKLLALALQDNYEAIQIFLEQASESFYPIRFEFSSIQPKSGPYFSLQIGPNQYGFIRLAYSISNFLNFGALIAFAVFGVGILVATFRFYTATLNFLRQQVVIPLRSLGRVLDDSNRIHDLQKLEEIRSDVDEIRSVKNQLLLSAKKLQNIEILEAKNQIATQVAHDIRSPLAAFKIILSSAKPIGEVERDILTKAADRVKKIADDLFSKSKNSYTVKNEISPVYIPDVIDQVVKEKTFEFESRESLQINWQHVPSQKNCFSEVNSNDLQRIISNLINNSIEAMSGCPSPVLTLSCGSNQNRVWIEVADNGPGIPAHVLNRLGKVQVSYGKSNQANSGLGLGVAHAAEKLMSWGGTLKFDSSNLGTKAQIELPVSNLYMIKVNPSEADQLLK